ncbi:MobF family relaxase [Nocardia mikamii]|uniref:MobF family relaxase n=1 Tax=Nocardia mikamii TaxID=508464 RepID=UPI0007A53413|nr:MobF family relaxase [Nocardia mikamii]
MTATLHKILAGESYRYYLRQVAAADATDRGPGTLSDYYSAHGEQPGRWWGNGLAALDLSRGDEVTEAQMRALFGQGRHPDAEVIAARVIASEAAKGISLKTAKEIAERATRLGNPYRTYSGGNEFRKRCGEAFTEHNIAAGVDVRAGIPDEVRARIRTEVAAEMFTEHYERAPLDDRELSGFVAKISRPKSAAVAGFDITFSPVKSVSALWAIAPLEVSERVASAHDAAVDDALGWLQEHGIFTRAGRNGVRQLDVDGLIAARFVHRESRCGDPDLHTHVLIANRVRGADGRWRTLDAAVIYRLNVTVSEIYNTRLEHHLRADLGVEFSERPGTNPNKRPIREVDGIPAILIRYWSRRDAAIRKRLGELTVDFHQQLGREPTPTEMWNLAQVATLQTRPGKHLSRSWAEHRRDWRTEATTVLGSHNLLDQVVATSIHRASPPSPVVDEQRIADIARHVVEVVSAQRSVWQHHHIRAETERCIRALTDRDSWASVSDAVVAEALSPCNSLARGDPDIDAEPDLATVAEPFQRRDGASVYTRSGTQTYTCARQLDIEYRLAELSVQPGARTIDESFVTAAIDDYNTDSAHQGQKLNAGQTAMVTSFATSPARIAVASAPAGTGKTTAMRVLVDAWRASGGTVLGLAPEAAPAAILAEATRARVETVDRLLHILDQHRPSPGPDPGITDRDFPAAVPRWVTQIDDRTLVIIDEHIKLSDGKRLQLFEFLTARGATVRCVGDDRQLPAIDAGGAGIDTAHTPDSITLTHVVRFADTAEATAGLALREGDPSGLGFYLDHQRIHSGSAATIADKAYAAWFADQHAGRDAIMLAPTHDIVTDLNDRARADRLARTTESTATTILGDGLSASAGDIVCTRRNNRALLVGKRDWVRNGYRWRIDTVHPDGSLTVTHLRPGGQPGNTTVLPPEYVGLHVRLGYAMTIDSAQGTTADACHTVLTDTESRNQLYVAITRGIHANHLYLPTTIDGSELSFWTEPAILSRTAVEVLQHILAREATHASAQASLRDALDPYRRLGRAVDVYLDGIGVATEHTLGADALTQLDQGAEILLPGLTDAPAYPVLRQHLSTLALAGQDPVTALRTAIKDRELDTAKDSAAVLDWRLDTSGAHSTGTGPLPWLHGLPHQITDTTIANQLRARHRIVTDLATQITADARTWTAAIAPVWARPLLGNQELIAELAVWRAANHVPDTDLRPTGPTRFTTREYDHQTRLNTQVTDALGDLHTATHTWEPLAKRLDTRITSDPWWPVLAAHIDTAAAAGIDIDTLLTNAAAQRPLPDDMPAAALWSRLRLNPSALTTRTSPPLHPDWTPHLHDIVGHDLAEHIINGPAWPRLVAAIDTAPADWAPHDLLAAAHELLLAAAEDATTLPRPDQLATALAWRIEILTRPTPEPENTHTANETATTMTPPTPQPRNAGSAPGDGVGPSPAEIVHAIGDLVSTGRIDEARTTFIRLTAHLNSTQRDIFQRVITTLSSRAYPIANARLRWAADRYPEHRAFILAAIPATDPHLHQPLDHTQPGHDPRTVARDHREYIDPTRRRPARPAPGRDAFDTYTHSFADLDADPTHLPVPEGTGTTRHQAGRGPSEHADTTSFLAGTGNTIDYDRYAVPDHHELPCLACGLERARTDTQPRHYDDGLCTTCRDDNQPGIPDHEPADHAAARCTFITDQHPPATALALLRKDWRHTRNPADRATIETFADALLTAETAATDDNPSQDRGSDSGSDPSNPTQMLTDTELTQAIGTLQLRIHLADDEATIYGPAHGTTTAANPVDTDWLKEELSELQIELTRRAHLTPEQTTTEQAQRANRRNGTVSWSAPERAALHTNAAAETDGPGP